MTQEEKQLLLKDLCARLPYGTQVYIEVLDDNRSMLYGGSGDDELDTMWIGVLQSGNPYHIIKPYLRPMSSMTEEEAKEMFNTICSDYEVITIDIESDRVRFLCVKGEDEDCRHIAFLFDRIYSLKQIDWLLANHFDYRGLIPMGLALEAPEGMY